MGQDQSLFRAVAASGDGGIATVYQAIGADGVRSVSSEPLGAASTVPAETVLTYPAKRNPTDVTYHGGLLGAGLPGGLPVQLLFWGTWWNGDGTERRVGIEQAVQRLLGSPYFDRLDQYRIVPHPTYRGSTTVLDPAPPAIYSGDNIHGLITTLIDDNKFPEPDDAGGRIGYFVMMPDGTKDSKDECGAHGNATERDFPFLDWDTSWVAWINAGDVDTMTSCFSHELVEMLTDPENNGWYVDALAPAYGELGDLCDVQEGWVDNVVVRCYWSASDNACVIPTRPLSVRIDGTIRVTETKPSDSGTYSPPSTTGLKHFVPACHLEDNQYPWTLQQRVETAELTATAAGFHSPSYEWSVAGQKVGQGASRITPTLNVTVQHPAGPEGKQQVVNLAVNVADAKLTLTNDSTVANFDLPISVTVTESSYKSLAQAQNGARTADLVVSFVGADLEIGGSYAADVQRCQKAALEFWKATNPGRRVGVHGPTGGPQKDGDVRLTKIPAWVAPADFNALKAGLLQANVIAATNKTAGREYRRLLFDRAGVVDPGDQPAHAQR
jgi:hypothetical protein